MSAELNRMSEVQLARVLAGETSGAVAFQQQRVVLGRLLSIIWCWCRVVLQLTTSVRRQLCTVHGQTKSIGGQVR